MTSYNASEYYKKMLQLQERLRKSEEEKIRLEERFALLEHESRSRHETCINRLRMRYIDFLEEQQARDDRNHQLLGALDRVDSSLALMTAKTDRLGALRKQYEASLLAGYDNRRANGSVTGDSGVASQIDERYQRYDESFRTRENLTPNRSTIGLRHRTNDSSLRPISYGNFRSGNYEHPHVPPYKFSGFPQADLGHEKDYRIRKHEPNFQSIRHESRLPQNSSLGNQKNEAQYRIPEFKVSSPEYKLRPNVENITNFPKFGKSVRDLSVSDPGSKFVDHSPGIYGNYYGDPSITNLGRRNSILPPQTSELRNFQSSPRLPKLSEIFKKELNDEELASSVIENQLEDYISKIRSLHRDPEAHSLEEIDHEQNTSGDLLNVTLSDDDVPSGMEDKPGEKLIAPELGNILSLAKELANKTSTRANEIANLPGTEKCIENPTVLEPSENDENNDLRKISKNNESSRSDTGHQLASINRPLGTTNSDSRDKHESLAKNGISGVATSGAELDSRPARNIQETRRLVANKGKRETSESGLAGISEERSFDENRRRSSVVKNLDSRYEIASGEEFVGDDMHELAEDLEPWNLSALERKVQEIILNDEAHDDFIARGTSKNVDKSFEEFPHSESSIPEINETSAKEIVDIAEENKLRNSEDSTKNDEKFNEIENTVESTKTNFVAESIGPEHSVPENSTNHSEQQLETHENNEYETEKRDYENQDYQSEYPQDPNLQYEYSNDQYQGIQNQEYSGYDQMGNVQYESNQGENYDYGQGYVEGQENYVQDPNQDNYLQDPNQENYVQDSSQENFVQNPDQQNYAQDSSQENYLQDPNQQNYEQDPNQQNYVQDPSQENYVQDPNQQNYVQDFDQQNYVQDPNQQDYVQDPSQQNYVQDSDQQNFVEDPNQHNYVQDSTQQEYMEQQYSADPNQPYMNPDQQYIDNNQYPVEQYAADSNQEYSKEYQTDGFDQHYVDPNHQEYTTEYPYQTEEYSHNESYTGAQDNAAPAQESEIKETEISDSKVSKQEKAPKKSKDVIKSILESDTESTIEKNVSNTESDFDFN